MSEFRFRLGEEVRDRLTGFKGIVMANTEWLTGCNTVSVKPQGLKDGAPLEHQMFDEPYLERVGIGLSLTEPPPAEPRQKGGPRPQIRRKR